MAEITLSDVIGMSAGDRVRIRVDTGDEYRGEAAGVTFDRPISPAGRDIPMPEYIHVIIDVDGDESLRLRQMSKTANSST